MFLYLDYDFVHSWDLNCEKVRRRETGFRLRPRLFFEEESRPRHTWTQIIATFPGCYLSVSGALFTWMRLLCVSLPTSSLCKCLYQCHSINFVSVLVCPGSSLRNLSQHCLFLMVSYPTSVDVTRQQLLPNGGWINTGLCHYSLGTTHSQDLIVQVIRARPILNCFFEVFPLDKDNTKSKNDCIRYDRVSHCQMVLCNSVRLMSAWGPVNRPIRPVSEDIHCLKVSFYKA